MNETERAATWQQVEALMAGVRLLRRSRTPTCDQDGDAVGWQLVPEGLSVVHGTIRPVPLLRRHPGSSLERDTADRLDEAIRW